MEKLLCPSMMCADFASLKTEIENLEKGGIDIFHLDVMDWKLCTNLGWDYKISNISVRQPQNHVMCI